MFSFITGKIKTIVIGILALALPIIYVMGRLGGSTRIKQAVLKEEAEKAKKRANFYQKMAEHEQEIESGRTRSHSEFIDKLRKDGL